MVPTPAVKDPNRDFEVSEHASFVTERFPACKCRRIGEASSHLSRPKVANHACAGSYIFFRFRDRTSAYETRWLLGCSSILYTPCVPVYFRMFLQAAFSSASKALSRAAPAEPVDLDLTGPDCSWPFVSIMTPLCPMCPRKNCRSPTLLSLRRCRHQCLVHCRQSRGVSAKKCIVRRNRCSRRVLPRVPCAPRRPRCVRLRHRKRQSSVRGRYWSTPFLRRRSCWGRSPRRRFRGSCRVLARRAWNAGCVRRRMAPSNGGVLGGNQAFVCVHTSLEKSPLFVANMRAVRLRGETGLARLRQAVAGNYLPFVGCCFGCFLEDAVAVRCVDCLLLRKACPRYGWIRRPAPWKSRFAARRKISSASASSLELFRVPCGEVPVLRACYPDGCR